MGLRCLFGHDFGDPEVEREREESDSEVVVTVREVKTCDRCGDRRVVTENTEVTTVRTPEEVGLDESDEDETDDEPTHPTVDDEDVEEDFEPPTDPDEDDGEILDDDEDPERERGEWPDADDVEEPAEGAAPRADAAEATDDEPAAAPESEGAEILDDGGDEDGEQPWPERESPPQEADDGGASAEWPEHDGEDEGFAAESGGGERTDVSFGGGLAPESAATGDSQSYVGHDADDGDVEELVRADDAGTASVDSDTEYFCPNCGHADTATGSSMRAGDICPECHGGYIAERER